MQISQKIQADSYKSKNDFLNDFVLLYKNMASMYGRNSELAKDAAEIARMVRVDIREHREHLI